MKTIKTNGVTIKLDDHDYNKLKDCNITRCGSGLGVKAADQWQSINSFLMPAPDGYYVKHINGDKYDFRRKNLFPVKTRDFIKKHRKTYPDRKSINWSLYQVINAYTDAVQVALWYNKQLQIHTINQAGEFLSDTYSLARLKHKNTIIEAIKLLSPLYIKSRYNIMRRVNGSNFNPKGWITYRVAIGSNYYNLAYSWSNARFASTKQLQMIQQYAPSVIKHIRGLHEPVKCKRVSKQMKKSKRAKNTRKGGSNA